MNPREEYCLYLEINEALRTADTGRGAEAKRMRALIAHLQQEDESGAPLDGWTARALDVAVNGGAKAAEQPLNPHPEQDNGSGAAPENGAEPPTNRTEADGSVSQDEYDAAAAALDRAFTAREDTARQRGDEARAEQLERMHARLSDALDDGFGNDDRDRMREISAAARLERDGWIDEDDVHAMF